MRGKTMILAAIRDRTTVGKLRCEMEAKGFSLMAVDDGKRAAEAARRLRPDVLVIDCILPGMDGPAVMDSLSEAGCGIPCVIGGAMHPFAERCFRRRGVQQVLSIPWRMEELCRAICGGIEAGDRQINWAQMQENAARAQMLLDEMGMRRKLRGYMYLACAAALACQREERLYALGADVYAPVAAHFGTTAQNVERLIRHAVERSMDAQHAKGVYRFFGNTIDPTRGKPTNAQAIGMLAERLRTQGKGKGSAADGIWRREG